MNIFTKADAIMAINPDSQFSYYHSPRDEIKWLSLDIQQPTEAEINKKVIELQAEYDNDYSRKREAEYPSIQECIHAILDDDLTALQEKRQAVKTKYPKG